MFDGCLLKRAAPSSYRFEKLATNPGRHSQRPRSRFSLGTNPRLSHFSFSSVNVAVYPGLNLFHFLLLLLLYYNIENTEYSHLTQRRTTSTDKSTLRMVVVDRTDFYPGLCSPEAVLAAPSTWTADIVVRSLRRRLWKAFVDEDHETALRAYQATFQDFLQWIQEEDNLRHEEAERRLEHGKRVSRELRHAQRVVGNLMWCAVMMRLLNGSHFVCYYFGISPYTGDTVG